MWYTALVTLPMRIAALPARHTALRERYAPSSKQCAPAGERLVEVDRGAPPGPSVGRRWKSLRACAALVVCLALVSLPPSSQASVRQDSDLRPPSAALAQLPELPFNVSASSVDSRAPRLAVSASAAHLVWEEDERIRHRFWDGAAWSSSRSIAFGEQPDVALDSSGVAHVSFVNEFGGNYEIYHCRWNGTSWSLPRNVSNTSGVSSAPRVGIGGDDTVHIVWADNTPGYKVIYHAYWNGTYWLNEPVPSALGGAPTVAVGWDGVLHLAWQDRDALTAPYEIYHIRRSGGNWSLPENLSDTAATPSIIPSISVGPSRAHVAWQEKTGGRYAIVYTHGLDGFWSVPETISENEADAFLPTLQVNISRTAYVGWDEGTLALYRQRGSNELQWSTSNAVGDDPAGATDLQLAVDAAGRLHAAWAERVTPSNWDVFYQCLAHRLVLPLAVKTH